MATKSYQFGSAEPQKRYYRPDHPQYTITTKARSLTRHICSAYYNNSFPRFLKIEKVEGGSFNDIIAVKIRLQVGREGPLVDKQFIIRYSRDGNDGMGQQTATLNFVRSYSPSLTKLIPEVIHYDDSGETVFERPFMFMQAMPGERLLEKWQYLNFEQRKGVARDLAKVMSALDKVHSPVVGQIDQLESGERSTVGLFYPGYKVFPVPVCDEIDSMVAYARTTPQAVRVGNGTVLDYISWRLRYITNNAKDSDVRIIYKELLELAWKLHEKKGLFAEKYFTLMHADLMPRNILVQTLPNGEAEVSAVLDWDDTLFAPRILSAHPPVHLWREDEDSEDESVWVEETSLAPESDGTEEYEVRKAFEDQLLKEGFHDFNYLAYDEYCKLARKVAHYALYCFDPQKTLADVKLVVSEGRRLF